jgi:competence protein ComEC
MAQSVHIAVLDVGHRDCAVVYTEDRTGALVIDCGHAPTLLDFLNAEGIQTVALALVTHNDSDHVGGLAELVRRHKIETIALHPDIKNVAGRETRTIRRLQEVVATAGTDVLALEPSNLALLAKFQSLPYRVTLLYPTARQRFLASTANRESGVVRVEYAGRTALFGGDLDYDGWAEIWSSNSNAALLRAEVFKFPHHGGSPVKGTVRAGRVVESTKEILDFIMPSVTIISTGEWRGWDHPDAGVMEALRDYRRRVGGRVMCTEATSLCDPNLPARRGKVLTSLPSVFHSLWAREGNCCPCAGTVRMTFDAGGAISVLQGSVHPQIVGQFTRAQCVL